MNATACIGASLVLLAGFPLAHPAGAQDEKRAPDAKQGPEKVPALEDLRRRAQLLEKKRESKPLQFTARYRVVDRGLVSSWGGFRCWGTRDFRIEYEKPNLFWSIRTAIDSNDERVLASISQIDTAKGSSSLMGRSFRQMVWKDAEAGSKKMLMGLLLFYVPQPARMLEMAKKRYFDLKVVKADTDETGTAVWVLEAVLPPHEVPEGYRSSKLARVRMHVGKEDLMLRSLEILTEKGELFQLNQLCDYRFGAPEGERPAALVVPKGEVVHDLLPK